MVCLGGHFGNLNLLAFFNYLLRDEAAAERFKRNDDIMHFLRRIVGIGGRHRRPLRIQREVFLDKRVEIITVQAFRVGIPTVEGVTHLGRHHRRYFAAAHDRLLALRICGKLAAVDVERNGIDFDLPARIKRQVTRFFGDDRGEIIRLRAADIGVPTREGVMFLRRIDRRLLHGLAVFHGLTRNGAAAHRIEGDGNRVFHDARPLRIEHGILLDRRREVELRRAFLVEIPTDEHEAVVSRRRRRSYRAHAARNRLRRNAKPFHVRYELDRIGHCLPLRINVRRVRNGLLEVVKRRERRIGVPTVEHVMLSRRIGFGSYRLIAVNDFLPFDFAAAVRSERDVIGIDVELRIEHEVARDLGIEVETEQQLFVEVPTREGIALSDGRFGRGDRLTVVKFSLLRHRALHETDGNANDLPLRIDDRIV